MQLQHDATAHQPQRLAYVDEPVARNHEPDVFYWRESGESAGPAKSQTFSVSREARTIPDICGRALSC
ncbi:hypothetical protein TNCV_4270581 [Trichonephila clavipes]|nr:hypothetical protein TNCV_4270581 [Trichonephila clavipes]